MIARRIAIARRIVRRIARRIARNVTGVEED
jgi:hypothetical protein